MLSEAFCIFPSPEDLHKSAPNGNHLCADRSDSRVSKERVLRSI